MNASRKRLNIEHITTFLRHKRLRCFDQVGKMEEDTTKKRCGCSEREEWGRVYEKWIDSIREDINESKMTEDMAQNRSVLHVMTKAGPWRRNISENRNCG